MTTTNEERASFAETAAVAYSDEKKIGALQNDFYDKTELVVQDLIGDLCHYLRSEGIDPKRAYQGAWATFQEEEVEEADQ